jgi:hypothetical protein
VVGLFVEGSVDECEMRVKSCVDGRLFGLMKDVAGKERYWKWQLLPLI